MLSHFAPAWRHIRLSTAMFCIVALLLLSAGLTTPSHAQAATSFNDLSFNGPSATYCAGSRFVAFRGTDSHINIKNVNSGALYAFLDTTYDTPSIICYANVIYIAWQSADIYQYILIGEFNPQYPCSGPTYCDMVYTANPLYYQNGNPIQTPYAPTLATNGSMIWIAWTKPNTQMYVKESTDGGASWGNEHALNDHSANGIALAYSSLDNQLYLSWPGTDATSHLNIALYQESDNLYHMSSSLNDQVRSSLRPGIAIVADGMMKNQTSDHTEIILSWIGTTNTNISVGSWDRDNTWNEITVLSHNTFNSWVSPALVTDGVNLTYEYADTSSHLQEQSSRSGHAAVIFVHGFGAVNCNSLTTSDQTGDPLKGPSDFLKGQYVLNGQQMTWEANNLRQVQYYNNDSGCDDDIRKTVAYGPCWNYGDSNSKIGTWDESIYHISCELAWYVYENFNYTGSNVEFMSHSMGGLIVRNMIYQIASHKARPGIFPPSFPNVSDVVDFSTPHDGIPTLSNLPPIFPGLPTLCSQCKQGEQMLSGSPFILEMMDHAQNPQVNSFGTDWTLVGSDNCDGYVDGTKAVYMASNHAFRYHFPGGTAQDGCYDHHNILNKLPDSSPDSATNWFQCTANCTSHVNARDLRTWTQYSNRPSSLLLMAYALWYGNW